MEVGGIGVGLMRMEGGSGVLQIIGWGRLW